MTNLVEGVKERRDPTMEAEEEDSRWQGLLVGPGGEGAVLRGDM